VSETRCLYHRDADKTLCGEPNNDWLTASISFSVEELCPHCLDKLRDISHTGVTKSFSERLGDRSITPEAIEAIKTVEAAGLHWRMSENSLEQKTFFIGIRLLPNALTIIDTVGDDLSDAICTAYQLLLVRLPEVERALE